MSTGAPQNLTCASEFEHSLTKPARGSYNCYAWLLALKREHGGTKAGAHARSLTVNIVIGSQVVGPTQQHGDGLEPCHLRRRGTCPNMCLLFWVNHNAFHCRSSLCALLCENTLLTLRAEK